MFTNKNIFRWISIAISFIIVALILWNTYQFSQKFKEEERKKMEIWSLAYNDILQNVDDLNANVTTFSVDILNNNTTTPMILVNSNGEYDLRNINNVKSTDSSKIKSLINQFKEENTPIEVTSKYLNQTIYYGNAPLINKMKYYPLALLLIIFLFGAVIYFFYRSTKNAVQNKLWAGMAKETAHQIGTPLSSLVGWVELLKTEDIDKSTITEINKDIDRLQTITDRFSKIGSVPKLERKNIVIETEETFRYLESRSSKLVTFSFEAPEREIYANINSQLFSWTIENMVKNAIDAMKGKGNLKISIAPLEDFVKIKIEDTGKGIPKSEFKKIFEPGHTTKKRGWGLGLSLAKRIIEDYHNGKIKVLNSEIDKGTTMQISLKTVV
ncbi:sensor histidine kinase [Pseudofulvibacter geojedonensis]|uniref:histidine kinase n=1 Tax=Pseudofulvibacter geojedonensis TaxID=1123758 RepID=A0ABW3I1M5_9FLAO